MPTSFERYDPCPHRLTPEFCSPHPGTINPRQRAAMVSDDTVSFRHFPCLLSRGTGDGFKRQEHGS